MDAQTQIITELLKLGTSGGLIILILRIYGDLRPALEKRIDWFVDQLTKYMDRDREIVTKAAEQGIAIASKYSSRPAALPEPAVPG